AGGELSVAGRFPLGQRLAHGGVKDPAPRDGGGGLLYFPGSEGCVYVLDPDPAPRRCRLVLWTNHPADSLRSEPAVVAAPGAEGPRHLLLCQAESSVPLARQGVRLRAFPLPLSGRNAPEAVGGGNNTTAGLRVDGLNDAVPLCDGETLVLVTDRG